MAGLARGWRRWAVALLAITVGAWAAASAAAIGQPDDAALSPGLPLAAGLPPASLPGQDRPVLGAEQGPVTAFIELAATPAVDIYHAERRAGRSTSAAADAVITARNQVQRVAERVLGALRSRDRGADELFRTVNAVPGLVVTAEADRIRELTASPDVRSVRKVVPKTTTNSSAIQLTNTVRAWQHAGRLGDGVRIGIIDDGIDYTHADFGGPGTDAAYAAIDRTEVAPAYFPTSKVIGGIDFAGDDYDASGAAGPDALTPKPDSNPLACGDHGTHVAGSAAGFGVNADGTTFRGDYQQLDPSTLNALRIGPGAAPRALLYAVKVFGCDGSTNLVPQALDWSLDPNGDGDFSDHLDVVNLSLGSNYGAPDDPDSLFVRKLADNGVLSVISAGNGGDIYDIGGAPGNTPEALTVASSRDSSVLRDGAEVTAPGSVAGIKGGQYSLSFTGFDNLDRMSPVVALTDSANQDGCEPYSAADAAAVAGKHVWLEWDDEAATRRCGSLARADHALAAGANGVLLTSTLEQFTAAIAGNEGVPMFQFTGPDAAALRPALAAGTLQVRLAGTLRASVPTDYPGIADTPSMFTSRAVRGPAVKPDVSAPGDTIASALVGTGADPLVISGTSMAAPHVAGIGGLVRQAHPDWTVAEVKAAVMNTAGEDIYAQEDRRGPIHAPNRVGAGRVDAEAAVRTPVLAMVADEPGSVSATFGVVQAAGPVVRSKVIKVVNKGDTAASYTTSYEPITTVPGVRYELSADSLDIVGSGVAELILTLHIDDPAALRKTADPTIEKIQLDQARQFLADASGRVVLTPAGPGAGDRQALRVPVYAAPKPVADIAVPDELRFRGGDQQAVLTLSGDGLDQGSGDAAYRSLISVLQLQVESGRLPECSALLTADCAPNETARGGDIQYVGVTSTAPLAVAQGEPAQALLAFGITTWGEWYNLGGNTIPFVDIDINGDGTADFEVFVTKADGTDVLLAETVDLRAPDMPTVDLQPINGQFGDVDTGVFDTNVVLLPVSLAVLGIDPAAKSAPIIYTAGVAGFYTGPGDTDSVIDTTNPALFDAARPALWTEGAGGPALSYLARAGDELVVHRDAGVGGLLAQLSSQLLVLHLHNAAGDRVQAVRVGELDVLPVIAPLPPLPLPAVPVPPPAPFTRPAVPEPGAILPAPPTPPAG
ncbi:MAG: S8 family peptidase [Pseudonocardiaceae bacterium]